MKKLIACIFVLLVLVIGCTQPQVEDEGTSVDNVAEGSTAKEVKAADTVLGEEIGRAIDEQLVSGDRYILPVNYKKIKYGESFIFGLGVQNVLSLPDRYQISMNFDKAYDRMTNPIDTDEDTMNKWIKTIFEPFELDQYTKETISIKMQAGDIKPGVRPKAGTYVFDVDILNAGGSSVSIRKEYGKTEISIRVE